MTGDNLRDEHHVIRYAKPTSIRTDGKVDGSEFRLRPHRPDDTGLSVNWLEYYRDYNKDEQLAEIRRRSRLKMRKRGRLAELNVGATKQHVNSVLRDLRFIHKPLEAEGEYDADPSHSEIVGLPPGDSEQADLIGDMIAECMVGTHPALV